MIWKDRASGQHVAARARPTVTNEAPDTVLLLSELGDDVGGDSVQVGPGSAVTESRSAASMARPAVSKLRQSTTSVESGSGLEQPSSAESDGEAFLLSAEDIL